jgi:pimeloyl-ACP methyl ester carboxylesterase
MPHLSGGLRSWLGRIARGAALLIVVAVVSGALYQNVLLARDRRAYPMPGQLIDVGGYKMHLYCTGQGDPPVILDSGQGDSYMAWHNVQPEIAKFVSVCSYDRAGLGYSQPRPRPRTSRVFAEELHELIHAAGVAPPYILVGHSFGGFNVRLFASRYRSETAGMVLVDSGHPDQPQRMPQQLKMNDELVKQWRLLQFTEPIGIPRLVGDCGDSAAIRAAECTFNHMRESVTELETVRESASEVGAAGDLGNMALIVISQDTDQHHPDLPEELDKTRNRVWAQMQEELSHLSTNGTLVIAKGSGHDIQNQRLEIVIEAVHNVVNRARDKSALPERDRNQKR